MNAAHPQQVSYARLRPPTEPRTSADAYDSLLSEFVDAAISEPTKKVRTPGFNGSFTRQQGLAASVVDLVNEGILGTDPEAITTELLRIVGTLARGPINEQVQRELHMRSKALLGTLAEAHAAYHCDDLARQIEGDDE